LTQKLSSENQKIETELKNTDEKLSNFESLNVESSVENDRIL
jgi:hypothetical protein